MNVCRLEYTEVPVHVVHRRVRACPGAFCTVNWSKQVFVEDQGGDDRETVKIDYWVAPPLKEKGKKESAGQEAGKGMVDLKTLVLNREESKNYHRAPGIDPETDQLLLKCRKCIPPLFSLSTRIVTSLVDIMTKPQYKHMRFSNFCDQFRICESCYRAYQTIDKMRQEVSSA